MVCVGAGPFTLARIFREHQLPREPVGQFTTRGKALINGYELLLITGPPSLLLFRTAESGRPDDDRMARQGPASLSGFFFHFTT